MNTLPDSFWVRPEDASAIMDKEELQAVLWATDGLITVRGQLWEIKAKSAGAGMYRVTLKRWRWKERSK